MILAALTLAAAPIDPAAAGQPVESDKRTWITKVGSSTYRVTLAAGVVNVVNKAMLTGRSMNGRDQMRTAVKQATGCEIVDELWFDAKLKGKLACPDGYRLPPSGRQE